MEVNTFKCDICGEVYHVEEDSCREFITIHKHYARIDEGEITNYRHICPKCSKTLNKIIGRTGYVEGLIANIARKNEVGNKLKGCFSRIYHECYPRHSFWLSWCDMEYYDTNTDTIIEYIKKLKSRVNGQLWVIRVLAFVVGGLIGCALAQLL